jgi:hypothetical protein
MLVYNKTILLQNLKELNELLTNDNSSLYSKTKSNCIYENKIAIEHYLKKNMNIVRIWRTKALFDYWFDDFKDCGKNFIGALDYTIHSTYIKIDYLCINNSEMKNMYNNPLDEYDSEDLIKSLIHFIKMIAKKENKDKIIIDVHENLRLYNQYYYYNGFDITNRKSKDRPFWIEAEINV